MALQSAECKADPSRESTYQFCPLEYIEENNLPDNACVCRSMHCHRFVGLAGAPKKPGRKRKGAADDLDGIPVVEGTARDMHNCTLRHLNV